MVALARAMLDDPHWGWHAAHELGAEVARPNAIPARGAEAVAGGGLSLISARISLAGTIGFTALGQCSMM